jgi:hypothetical protein
MNSAAVAFPKPVVNAGLPFVSFQDPRASIGNALVQPAAAH